MIPFPHDRGRTVIATATGYFDLADPRPDDICLEDIALGLCRIARFTGHGEAVVTVARHSVNCYRRACVMSLPMDVRRLALMHDAHEVYIGDVSSPLKALLPEYRRIEARVWSAVAKRFGLSEVMPREVKEIDALALISEASVLFPDHDRWPGWPDPCRSMAIASDCPADDYADFMAAAAECGVA